MSDTYKRWQPTQCPPWLQGADFAGELMRQSGALKDDLADRAQEATTAGFPDLAAADALPFIGSERMLPRITGESDATYAERLRLAWDTWQQAGTLPGLLLALFRAGFPATGTMYVIEEGGKHSRLVAGVVTTGSLMTQVDTGRPGWTFEGGLRLNTRFALLFDTNHATIDPTTSTGPASIAALNQLVATWKPGQATFMGSMVLMGGTRWWDWPTTLTWDAASAVWNGGSASRFIDTDGAYVDF